MPNRAHHCSWQPECVFLNSAPCVQKAYENVLSHLRVKGQCGVQDRRANGSAGARIDALRDGNLTGDEEYIRPELRATPKPDRI